MTPEQKAAYIMAAAVRAQVRALGMAAENQHRLSVGQSISYGEEAFEKLIVEEGIGYNEVIEFMRP